MTRYKRRTSAAALAGILHLPEETMSPTKTNSPEVHHRSSGYNVNATLLVCPITGYPCEGDLSYLCEEEADDLHQTFLHLHVHCHDDLKNLLLIFIGAW